MYVHPAFKVGGAEALAMLRERAFGLLVVTAPQGPIGVHLPFLVEQRDGQHRRLDGASRASQVRGGLS